MSEELSKNKMDVSVEDLRWSPVQNMRNRNWKLKTKCVRFESSGNEVEALNAISVEQVGEVNISNIPTVSEVVSSLLKMWMMILVFNILRMLGMIIPSISSRVCNQDQIERMFSLPLLFRLAMHHRV